MQDKLLKYKDYLFSLSFTLSFTLNTKPPFAPI